MVFFGSEVKPHWLDVDVTDALRDDRPDTAAPQPPRKPAAKRPVRQHLLRLTPAAVKAAMRFLMPTRRPR